MKDKLISDKLSDNQMLEDLQRLLDEELAEAGDEPALFVLAGALVRKRDELVVDCDSLRLLDLASGGERDHQAALGSRDRFFLSHVIVPFL